MKYLGIRLKIALFIGALALIVFGGDKAYQGLRYRAPVEISYADFVKQKPAAGWFHIKNCVFNVYRAVHFYEKNKAGAENDTSGITEIYVPAQGPKDAQFPGQHPNVSLLVITRDPEILSTYRELGDIGPNDGRAETYFLKNKNKIYAKRDVEGMVRAGLSSLSSDEAKQLQTNISPIDSDFVTLEEGKRPTFGAGLLMLLAGFALLVGQILFYIARRGR